MPLIETKGAASAQGFGEFAASSAGAVTYIEDVFSTYIYTGNGSSQTITNNIDLSTKGGLVWIKDRTSAIYHALFDTARGATTFLKSNATDANETRASSLTSFNTTGFSLSTWGDTNGSGENFASWTFRKQPKFFDIVTYTGDGTSGRVLNHNLGSTPGCIIWKLTSAAGESWGVYHRSLGLGPGSTGLWLNLATTGNDLSNRLTAVSSTSVTLGSNSEINGSAKSYVMYFFAHNAGGFGLTGTDNVISCGSFASGAGGSAVVNLGYEPQFVLIKNATSSDNWEIRDVMRELYVAGGRTALVPNSSQAEQDVGTNMQLGGGTTIPTSLGFQAFNQTTNSTFIYIAIRRPMKVPTSGATIFAPFYTNATSGTAQTTNFAVDWLWFKRATGAWNHEATTRLLGVSTLPSYTSRPELNPNTIAATGNGTGNSYNWTNTTFGMPDPVGGNQTALWAWRRAPGFFDVVAYTGTATARTITHNLTVAPELMIVKQRSDLGNWRTYAASQGNTKQAVLNATDQFDTAGVMWNSTTPTASVFSLGNDSEVNGSGQTYVAYLFATCAGVSKVGSYTGTGALQTINCGFTAGARYILIKRADSAGDWYIWDSARGISSSNDPYFVISTASEVTGTNYVDTDTTGFKVTAAASTTVNISAASYIFLAIA